MRPQKQTRRRGPALEKAILEATWAELIEHGYAGLTLENVARRAETSRPVLHRRWPSRTALATAALAQQFARTCIVIPDMGSLREELCQLLRYMSDRAGSKDLQLFFDMQKDLVAERSSFSDIRARIVDGSQFHSIIERAIRRGEIDPAHLTPRIMSLPLDLTRHEMMMTFQPLSDEAIHEIVDEIFLPLVRQKKSFQT
ncbi:TetR/AcrR family transcriptional regulator [Gluconobacter sphaericus]|uniref:TetR family transcriptional regulator n=1 Tax=Gluconobacter sphaericus NBRC 12467 TaxID=1307951 RepID=A0AA37WAL6_9PROT|nr:TetR/AcrR family transcriptional regulator [Gluconobacter sphaericus]MBF0885869.1 TetR/AcrR family transcriptional regulator [Gluconobacter sphaericus]MBS1086018.1 TetR/AcrR family transcriptional regulator [Gluconobacter sphaericus]MBS1101242.1 TetR/AcrR family transcriptional regulator [Gluconobacter sphaericus]QQX91597.1 TetR/AcrR family transcriptional regulator [Gluconobacter sphaericus]GEB43596.1 TetR family transcriptional regulator [Gluconobacter sphaericus NBRC 12467]